MSHHIYSVHQAITTTMVKFDGEKGLRDTKIS